MIHGAYVLLVDDNVSYIVDDTMLKGTMYKGHSVVHRAKGLIYHHCSYLCGGKILR